LVIGGATTDVVGKYFCIYEEKYVENQENSHYDQEVKAGNAAAIYVYVHGMMWVNYINMIPFKKFTIFQTPIIRWRPYTLIIWQL
jgi:hypothetical protein